MNITIGDLIYFKDESLKYEARGVVVRINDNKYCDIYWCAGASAGKIVKHYSTAWALNFKYET